MHPKLMDQYEQRLVDYRRQFLLSARRIIEDQEKLMPPLLHASRSIFALAASSKRSRIPVVRAIDIWGTMTTATSKLSPPDLG
jgi:hypothetical protein